MGRLITYINEDLHHEQTSNHLPKKTILIVLILIKDLLYIVLLKYKCYSMKEGTHPSTRTNNQACLKPNFGNTKLIQKLNTA